MLLHSFRKSKRSIATFCLLNILTQLVTPLKGYSTSLRVLSTGGGTPVAASTSSMVDGYTGDFRYSVPLVTVPGPNGESVSINAGYKAGIGVNQKASWIGLGWDYNPGEITRQVVGAPDDHNGRETVESGTGVNNLMAKFGSIYNNNINNIPTAIGWKSSDYKTINYNITATKRCDMIAQAQIGNNGSSSWNCISGIWEPNSNMEYRFKRHTAPHTSLAYDQYYVSGGLSGTIKPYFLGSVNIHKKNWYYATGLSTNNRKAQFHFENSNAQTIAISDYTISTKVNQTTNQIHSGVRVRYFTNAEINNNANLYNASTTSGYLNFQPITNTSTVRRPSASHDQDLIGAFQVTDASGITYHYSLPVYSFEEINYNWGNNSNYLYYSPKQYASSWKLTAVTGPDYQDVNGNYMADEGDSGYWIGYNYSLWSNDYMWSSMRYGFRSDAVLSPKMVNFAQSSASYTRYSKQNSISKGHSQVYALNYIQTASHTAFFVKSIREDEQSYNNVYNSSNKPIASLKLDRIVLLRNEDKALLINTTSLTGADLDTRFDYATCSSALNDVNFVNISRYNTNKALIDVASLKTVELVSDYTLAKKYTGNINNSFSYLSNVYGNSAYYTANGDNNIVCKSVNTFTSSSKPTNNGKLTLKKINFYDLNSEKITPSIDFGYDEANSLKNPDFNGDKYDLWGYYKKDYIDSHYVTLASKDDVDAWSLKEINTSLGGKIKVQYESDMYHKEGFSDEPLFYPIPLFSTQPFASTKPHIIFPISSMNQTNNTISYYDSDVSTSLSAGYAGNYLVLNKIGTCTPATINYNNGNSSYSPPATKRLIRCGNTNGNNFIGIQSEYIMKCKLTTDTYSEQYTSDYGMNYLTAFRDYLYGGGVRVKQIDIEEPFKNDTYSQKFTYGAGYCPVVPKPISFSSVSGPTNFDLVFNNKTNINSSLNGLVGYDNFTQTSVNQNGENSGSIVQSYNNSIIANPITTTGNTRLYVSTLPKSTNAQIVSAGGPSGTDCYQSAGSYFTSASGAGWNATHYFTQIYLDLALSNNNVALLGKLAKTEVLNSNGILVNSTHYIYEANNYICEKFINMSPPEKEEFYDYIPRTISQGIYSGCTAILKLTCTDTYNYSFSETNNYSCYLKSTITTNNGINFTSDVQVRDPYTGMPVQTRTTDPTKGTFTNFTTLAYATSTYSVLGLKTQNEIYKNQPSLSVGSKVVKRDKFVIADSYVTYSNSYPTRQYSVGNDKYIDATTTKSWYRLNETYSRLLDDDVDKSVVPQTTDWRKTSTGTLYDTENNRIEEMGLNNRKTASKWGYNNRYKLADISNANYNSFAFSSFEDQFHPTSSLIHFGGEIINGDLRSSVLVTGNGSLIKPHTGYYFASVAPNTVGPKFKSENFEVGRTYIAKVWVHKNSPASASLNIYLSGTTGAGNTPLTITKTIARSDASNITVGDWVLMTTELIVPEDFNTSGTHSLSVYTHNTDSETTNAYFDDLSFHPKDAVITGNVYNEKTGLLIAQLDNENFATLYNYDNAGRIVTTYKEYSGGIKKVTENTYHFAKP